MVTGDNKMGRDMDNLAKWRKDNLRQFTIRLHKKSDADMIEHLERQPSYTQYLIKLIREDMKK